MQAVDVAPLRERVQRREPAQETKSSRVAAAEEALRVARVAADTLGADYAAAQRREDQASLDALNARVCAYETRVSEMQASQSASLEATHDARIEVDGVNARLESAERRVGLEAEPPVTPLLVRPVEPLQTHVRAHVDDIARHGGAWPSSRAADATGHGLCSRTADALLEGRGSRGA